jgi:hypothetical protein
MAWARGEARVGVLPGGMDIFYGIQAPNVPIVAPVPPPTSAAARRHLALALEQLQLASALRPEDMTIRLGYAWALDQAGRDKEAIALYREVIAKSWAIESQMTSLGPSYRSLSVEAGQYLRAHLDEEADAAEIAQMHPRVARMDSLPRGVTPIVVPLEDGLPVETLIDPSAAVRFDLDGSGLRLRWQWITRRAGWLVHDRAATGRIDSALQLFGGVTFWMFWENGYEALASLDDNGDGELAGAELQDLALWVDADSDGLSDAGEVRPLAAHGIVSLSCAFRPGTSAQVAAMSAHGVRFRNGRERPTYDVVLQMVRPGS